MVEFVEGIVIETNDKMAKVKVNVHESCCNCGACMGESLLILNASNTIGAETGQHVSIVLKHNNAFIAVLVMYIMPVFMVLCGVLIGTLIAFFVKEPIMIPAFLCGVIFFVISIVIIKHFDAYFRADEGEVRIIKVN
jgi:sigma-E factor negative regulatory protein RseC